MPHTSKREVDGNGWIEVKDNPLSRVGVFEYSGAQIGGDPSRIYKVYRPEEELSNPETLESFRLLPFIDEHVMLGDSDNGLTPAEQKGIEGIIGEQVYYKDGMLYGNIKILSENLAELIESGKKQLSAGYRCAYEMVSGMWNGEHYDAIQRNIRGNHLALVQEGRMGPEVSVLDQLKFTFDTKELKMSKQALDERLLKVCDWAEAKMAKDAAEEEEKKKDEEAKAEDEAKRIKGIDEEEDKEKKKDAEDEEEEKKEEKKDGMDAALKTLSGQVEALQKGGVKAMISEVSARDELAKRLSVHIGTFDCSDKTSAEVAEYGVAKLGIECPKGSEKIALDGFFHASAAKTAGFGLDSKKATGGKLDAFINNNK